MSLRRTFGVSAIVCLVALAFGQAAPVRVASPDGRIAFTLYSGPAGESKIDGLRYKVTFKDKTVIDESPMGLELQGQPALGPAMEKTAIQTSSADESYRVPAGKSNPVRNQYNAALIEFASQAWRKINVEVRVYNDGVAFRYIVPQQAYIGTVRISRELTKFQFAKDGPSYPLVLQNYTTSWEDEYQKRVLSGLHPNWVIALPLLVEQPGTAWVAITEANLDNYPGMYLRHLRDSGAVLSAQLAPRLDDQEVAAIAALPVTTPWRVVMIGDTPGTLIESSIVINLNPPSAIADTSWIHPGKTAWDWWSGPTAKNLPSKAGSNTATMKYYIDFASESGLPYMLIDEGWALRGGIGNRADITKNNPEMDLPELLRYAKEKNVRLWLWAHWTEVDKYMEEAFPLYEKWGIAGVKIDFMDRDDQAMVNWYRRVLKSAAEHHLMVDFHGAFKPDGVRRTYPNLLTREGVMGAEYNKWSARETPAHNCTLPFTRMLAGPMDYTPGGFLNTTAAQFSPRGDEPMVMGTRAHQLALFVVFESELQMVADTPDHYRGERDFEFVRKVPASWDETHYITGQPMEYIALARRSGDDWYVGAITNWDARELEIPSSFLGSGKYSAEIYSDAPDAATKPTHTTIETRSVDRNTLLKLHLAPGGGAAIRIVPTK
jgi:alpha-glucosidase